MTPQVIIDTLGDLNPDAIFFENMDSALIGVGRVGTGDAVAVYSQSRILSRLHDDGFSPEEAVDYFSDKIAAHIFDINVPVILYDVVHKD